MNGRWYRMDLHVHSCLSPCADDDMTPYNIAQMAALERVHMLAVTDHNTAGNSRSAAAAAASLGISYLHGMEIESREGVHVLVYLPDALQMEAFAAYVEQHLPRFSHRPDIWGRQLRVDEEGTTSEYPWLLSQATTLSVDEIGTAARRCGALLIPAHVERRSFGLLSVLGTVPESLSAAALEYVDPQRAAGDGATMVNSDAHSLDALVRPAERYTYLWAQRPTFAELGLACSGLKGRKVVVGLDERTGVTLAGFGGKLRKRRGS